MNFYNKFDQNWITQSYVILIMYIQHKKPINVEQCSQSKLIKNLLKVDDMQVGKFCDFFVTLKTFLIGLDGTTKWSRGLGFHGLQIEKQNGFSHSVSYIYFLHYLIVPV